MKFPRTMQEAFGPYTDHNLPPVRLVDRVILAVSAVALLVVIALLVI